jgi:hypothetical protein
MNLPLTVNYGVAGQATNGVDYQTLGEAITIPANQTSTFLDVIPLTDDLVEGDETIVVELLAGPGYDVGYISERTVYGLVQDDADAIAGGTSLWAGQQLGDFTGFGGTFSTVTDPEYGDVIQASVGTVANPWNAQLRQTIDAAVAKGDILFAEFRAKAIGSDGKSQPFLRETALPT